MNDRSMRIKSVPQEVALLPAFMRVEVMVKSLVKEVVEHERRNMTREDLASWMLAIVDEIPEPMFTPNLDLFLAECRDRIRFVPEWGARKGWLVKGDDGEWRYDRERAEALRFARLTANDGRMATARETLREVRRSGVLNASPDEFPHLEDRRLSR